MKKLYWKIRYYIKDTYLKLRYKKRAPGFYYDDIVHAFVHPGLLREPSSGIEYLAEELTGCGLYYPFNIGEFHDHRHKFSWVLRDAYESADSFSIPKEYEHYYSEQELEMIRALQKRGIADGVSRRES